MVKAYLFILYLQALYLVSGSKLVEYRLGVIFGQVFYDSSENSLCGVYSLCSTTLTSDTLATYRGAYFAEGSVVVIFPQTIKSLQASCFLLPSQYSIIFWANIYSSASNADYLYYLLSTSSLQSKLLVDSTTEAEVVIQEEAAAAKGMAATGTTIGL